METLIDLQDPVTVEILRQEPDVKMKMIELLVRIRKGCCDGSMNIEIDDYTSIPLGFLQKRGLITGTLSIWVSNNLYCTLTDKGKKVHMMAMPRDLPFCNKYQNNQVKKNY